MASLQVRKVATAVFVIAVSISQCSALGRQAATKPRATFSLLQFDEFDHTCLEKGRLQDTEYCYSKTMGRILAMGKDAIPILISQLTDTRKTKRPVYDFWTYTTAGDVAYFFLKDLFTDSDWATNTLPDVELPSTNCPTGAEACWREYVRKHGRGFIEKQWRASWSKNKDRMYWDEKARCFRVSKSG